VGEHTIGVVRIGNGANTISEVASAGRRYGGLFRLYRLGFLVSTENEQREVIRGVVFMAGRLEGKNPIVGDCRESMIWVHQQRLAATRVRVALTSRLGI
jgi:hypothetical protein